MQTIPLSDIVILPNRQRREHEADAEQELIESIRTQGLMHPIVLRADGDSMILVAGERRLRAVTELSTFDTPYRHDGFEIAPGNIPYTSLGSLSPIEAEEAELEENIRRVDLSWQERADAENRLFKLRSTQAGFPVPISAVAKESRGADTPAVTSAVKTSIILANNMHRPEVKAAKSATEAMKALARVESSEKNAEKAAALGKEFLGGKHRVVNGDCLMALRAMAEVGETFDVIITDPPYGMGADTFGDSGGGAEGAHFYSDDASIISEVVFPALALLSQVSSPDAHIYLFCDIDKFHALRAEVERLGWTPFRTPLIWHKPSAFRAPWPDRGPQRKYECILYAVRGDLKCTKLAPDVLTYSPDENLGHQAQKPVALYQDLLSRSVRPGMKVLDPFGGTGPAIPAAHALSAIATVIEKDPAAYAIAATRAERLRETLQ